MDVKQLEKHDALCVSSAYLNLEILWISPRIEGETPMCRHLNLLDDAAAMNF